MLVIEERGKSEYLDKNLSEQRSEPTKNSTHIWRRVRESNPGHIGGRRALLRHPYYQIVDFRRYSTVFDFPREDVSCAEFVKIVFFGSILDVSKLLGFSRRLPKMCYLSNYSVFEIFLTMFDLPVKSYFRRYFLRMLDSARFAELVRISEDVQ